MTFISDFRCLCLIERFRQNLTLKIMKLAELLDPQTLVIQLAITSLTMRNILGKYHNFIIINTSLLTNFTLTLLFFINLYSTRCTLNKCHVSCVNYYHIIWIILQYIKSKSCHFIRNYNFPSSVKHNSHKHHHQCMTLQKIFTYNYMTFINNNK